jgi:hypothetical protein
MKNGNAPQGRRATKKKHTLDQHVNVGLNAVPQIWRASPHVSCFAGHPTAEGK